MVLVLGGGLQRQVCPTILDKPEGDSWILGEKGVQSSFPPSSSLNDFFFLLSVLNKIIDTFFSLCFCSEVGTQRRILKLGDPPLVYLIVKLFFIHNRI